MILIYTGNGKGKTSACVGQAIRAKGQGLKVAFAQFLKRDGQAGEQKMLATILENSFYAGGKGFFKKEEDRASQQEAATKTLNWVLAQIDASLEMLILDESLYAFGLNLLTKEHIETIIDHSVKNNFHIIFSGRNAPDWLINKADIVTEMKEIKHALSEGVKARKGIEF